MADVTIRFKTEEAARAQADLKRVRGEITDINEQIAVNRRRLVDATGAEKDKLQATNRRLSAERGLLAVQNQRTSALLPGLREEIRATTAAVKETNRFGSALDLAKGNLLSLVTEIGLFSTARFVQESIRASVEIEALSRGLTAITGDATAAARELRAVRELADQPGVTFRQASQATVALRAIDIDSETTNRIIRELGNLAAFSGGQGGFERGLVGFRQLIQRGRLSQEELNQLTENLGLASKAIQNFYGTVLAEDIQAQLDANGQGIEDFVETVLTEFEKLERFPADAASVKLKNLQNAFFELQAAVGDRFLPVIAAGAEGLTAFFDTLAEYVRGTDEAKESTDAFRKGLEAANTAAENRTPIENRIKDLQGFIAELEEAGEKSANFLSFRGQETEAGARLREYRTELELLQGFLDGATSSTADLVTEENRLEVELAAVRESLAAVNEEIANTDPRALAREKSGLRDEVTLLKNEEAELAERLSVVQGLLKSTLTPLKNFEEGTRETNTTLTGFNARLLESDGYFTDVNGRLHAANGQFANLGKAIEASRISFFTTEVSNLDTELGALEASFIIEMPELLRDISTAAVDTATDIESVVVGVNSFQALGTGGTQSPLDRIIEDMNSLEDAANTLEKEIVDAGQSFDDLRSATGAAEPSLDALEGKFDNLSDSVYDFREDLRLLSANAPQLLSGLFTVLSGLDRRFSGIEQTARSIASGDPLSFLASIPSLQQSVQSLVAPIGESDASLRLRTALSARRRVEGADVDEDFRQEVLGNIDNLIRETVIHYVRSLPAAFAGAAIQQQTASLRGLGVDFDFDRDVQALQALGADFSGQGNLFPERFFFNQDFSALFTTLANAEQAARDDSPSRRSDVSDRGDVVEPLLGSAVIDSSQFIEAINDAGDNFKTTVDTAATNFLTGVTTAVEAIAALQNAGAGGGASTFILQFPSGAAIEIGNELVEAQADGRFVGFGEDG